MESSRYIFVKQFHNNNIVHSNIEIFLFYFKPQHFWTIFSNDLEISNIVFINK